MSQSEQEREVIVQREIPFPRELVWKAMSDPNHVNHWWGPEGFQNENVVLNFSVGGAWTFEMVAPDGTRFPNHSVFKEIVPLEKIVYDHGDGSRFWFEATVTLKQTEKGTLVTIRSLFPTKGERDEVVEKYGAIEGGKQHLAKLEAYIARNFI
jgi:uncharacterized protein YndB with AHSA1/START domain